MKCKLFNTLKRVGSHHLITFDDAEKKGETREKLYFFINPTPDFSPLRDLLERVRMDMKLTEERESVCVCV